MIPNEIWTKLLTNSIAPKKICTYREGEIQFSNQESFAGCLARASTDVLRGEPFRLSALLVREVFSFW